MSNNLTIVNTVTKNMLAVKGKQPKAGDELVMHQFGSKGEYSAFWVVRNVSGGQQIVLQNDPTLAITIKGDIKDGARLELRPASSETSPDKNQLWSIADLPNIVSLAGSLKVLDGDGNGGIYPQLWYVLYNGNQQWELSQMPGL